MMGLFKKEPPREQLRFADADKLFRNGYLPVPLEFGDSTSSVAPHYAYCDDVRHGSLADEGVAVLTSARPNVHEDFNVIENSWVVAIEIVCSHKKIFQAIEGYVAATFDKSPALRRTEGTYDALLVFALGDKLPFAPPPRQNKYFRLPRDKDTDKFQTVRVVSAVGDSFAYSGLSTVGTPHGRNPDGAPFYWGDGRDLLHIPRSELPALDYEAADTLWADIENIFEREGAEWVV